MLNKVKKHVQKPSEWLMITAGLLILASVPLLYVYGDFTLWLFAKASYLVGVFVMLMERR